MDKFAPRPQFQNAMCSISDGRFAPVPGGVLIKRDNVIIGAVGVTGDTSDRDELCAIMGIRSVDLISDPEEPMHKGP